jgi:hypothetical protein
MTRCSFWPSIFVKHRSFTQVYLSLLDSLMSFLKSNSRSQTPTLKDGDQYVKVINGLKQIYNSKIRTLETTYNFEGMAIVLKKRKNMPPLVDTKES